MGNLRQCMRELFLPLERFTYWKINGNTYKVSPTLGQPNLQEEKKFFHAPWRRLPTSKLTLGKIELTICQVEGIFCKLAVWLVIYARNFQPHSHRCHHQEAKQQPREQKERERERESQRTQHPRTGHSKRRKLKPLLHQVLYLPSYSTTKV